MRSNHDTDEDRSRDGIYLFNCGEIKILMVFLIRGAKVDIVILDGHDTVSVISHISELWISFDFFSFLLPRWMDFHSYPSIALLSSFSVCVFFIFFF